MSDYASNETSTVFTHLARKFYNENFLLEDEIHTTNYWARHSSYGKQNQRMDTIVVNKSVIAPVANDSKAVFAIDFVRDVFAEFKNHFNKGIQRGVVVDDSLLQSLEAVNGWQDPYVKYAAYIVGHLDVFNSIYLIKRGGPPIKSFQDYLELFITYFRPIAREFPVTLTSFMHTPLIGPLSTGLSVEVLEVPYDDDESKVKFTQDKNFKFYAKQAALFGFNIDKNIPWRLTANLSSPHIQSAASQRRLTPVGGMSQSSGIDKILMENYILTHLNESDMLMFELANGFIKFIRENRKIFAYDKDCKERTIKKVVSRRRQSKRGQVLSELSEEFYLTYYFKIRLLEAGVDITKPGQHSSFIKRARELYKLLDKSKALAYINQKTKLLQSRGGL